MSFFSERRKIKEEAARIVRESEESYAKMREQMNQEFKKPANPLMIQITNDAYHIVNGTYNSWCVDGNLVLESALPGDLILTLRDDWNQETIKKLGFDEPAYSLAQYDPRDKRKYTIIYNDRRAQFIQIPIANILSFSETGDITSVSAVTEVNFKSAKKADVKSKTITEDTRRGIVRIADPIHGDYDIVIKYSQFQQFKTMIDTYKNQNKMQKEEEKTSTSTSPTEVLKELKELLDLGVITAEEFERKKTEILSRL